MPQPLSKTPLRAAFFCALALTGCGVEQQVPAARAALPAASCAEPTTPIASIQGDGPVSPLVGQSVAVKGVVTLLQADGFYLEEPGSDQLDGTSNAIFIQSQDRPGVAPGNVVSVHGQVAEIGRSPHSLTAITGARASGRCAANRPLPLRDIRLPLGNAGREALEGMRVHLAGPLTVTDVYRYANGAITLSGDSRQYAATELAAPGRQAQQIRRHNQDFALPAEVPAAGEAGRALAAGAVLTQANGVMAHDGHGLRLVLQHFSVRLTTPPATPAKTADAGLRVIGMNLHNYFNGDGKGGGFPTARGARNAAEFERQRRRIGAGIRALGPDLVGVMELENDGFGTASAAADFIRLLDTETGARWAVARPRSDDTGGDAITVGLFYRNERVLAVGPARTLKSEPFRLSRQPLAQMFAVTPDGTRILVVVNHLKSKGSCPRGGRDGNQDDGQGCWNAARTAAARAMTHWTRSLARENGTDKILILGDMNAYRREDPVDAIRAAGFTELLDGARPRPYSFVYAGLAGTLDYAFVSRALRPLVSQALIWHVNAGYPRNTDLARAWQGFSDHDPVIVDLALHHSSTTD